MDYKHKYLKYKTLYLTKQQGGASINIPDDIKELYILSDATDVNTFKENYKNVTKIPIAQNDTYLKSTLAEFNNKKNIMFVNIDEKIKELLNTIAIFEPGKYDKKNAELSYIVVDLLKHKNKLIEEKSKEIKIKTTDGISFVENTPINDNLIPQIVGKLKKHNICKDAIFLLIPIATQRLSTRIRDKLRILTASRHVALVVLNRGTQYEKYETSDIKMYNVCPKYIQMLHYNDKLNDSRIVNI